MGIHAIVVSYSSNHLIYFAASDILLQETLDNAQKWGIVFCGKKGKPKRDRSL